MFLEIPLSPISRAGAGRNQENADVGRQMARSSARTGLVTAQCKQHRVQAEALAQEQSLQKRSPLQPLQGNTKHRWESDWRYPAAV